MDNVYKFIKNKHFNSVQEIFFESSLKKTFKNQNEKDIFFDKWCGQYLNNELAYVYEEDDECLGYILLCKDTLKFLENNEDNGLRTFIDLYKDFPWHLHINFKSSARGRGLGSKLLTFAKTMASPNGIHLITGEDSRNVSFYNKNGFTHTSKREVNSMNLLFMGYKPNN